MAHSLEARVPYLDHRFYEFAARLPAEQKIRGEKPDAETIRAVAEEAVRGLHPTSDLHGSSEYRVHLLKTMTERALTRAAQRARRPER